MTVPSEFVSVGPFHQFKADAQQSTYSLVELMLMMVVKGRKWHNKEGRKVRNGMMKGRESYKEAINTKKEGAPVVGVMAGNRVDVLQHQSLFSCGYQTPPAEGGNWQDPGSAKCLHAPLCLSTNSERVQPKLHAHPDPSIPAL